MTRQQGFSVLEVAVAMALLGIVLAQVFSLLDPGAGALATQAASVDMEQRLRVAADALYKDLSMSGAGVYQGVAAAPLGSVLAPVLPYRHASSADDPPGSFSPDRITVMYVPTTVAQATLAAPGPNLGTGNVDIAPGPGCPVGDPACGFRVGMTVLVYDISGVYDTFAVDAVHGGALTLRSTERHVALAVYQPHRSTITEFTNAVYYVKHDPLAQADQLMRAGGAGELDVPVVDHVVGVRFDYYGDPQPPILTGVPLADPAGPWTTYGPPPPEAGQQIPTGGYPAGENCTFARDPVTGEPVPRLRVLGAGGSVLLNAAQLDGSDGGPWCPDAAADNRWDADLLRIRAVEVTLRIESANAALRGPAGLLFAHGGTSSVGNRWLPDAEMRFQVAPRNLRFGGLP
jgi:prepilin-type N-terminal cleavage/methylation domain-containing protein